MCLECAIGEPREPANYVNPRAKRTSEPIYLPSVAIATRTNPRTRFGMPGLCLARAWHGSPVRRFAGSLARESAQARARTRMRFATNRAANP
jgi:hypothetical protein